MHHKILIMILQSLCDRQADQAVFRTSIIINLSYFLFLNYQKLQVKTLKLHAYNFTHVLELYPQH